MKAALPLLASALIVSACVPSAKAPVSAPAPVARPAPVQPAPPPVTRAPVSDSWMDVPATPGEWRYAARGTGTGTEASFWSATGAPMLRLRCMADTRLVVLSLPESGATRPLVTVRTESTTRIFEAQPAGRETLVALAPGDPLLDAMALSKGRFAVESDGLRTLFLPSWAEVSRVIEDCR